MTRHGRAAYLETSFWSEDAEAAEARDSLSDEDEGIGSDESVAGPGDKAAAAASKRELSVTRFLRVLKQSVRRGHGPGQQRVPPGGRRPAAASAPPSAASAAVFGVELAQHLAATGSSVPGVVRWCTEMIEARAAADLRSLEGIYRLSGQTSQIKALRLGFDAGAAPALGPATANIHSVGSLLKMYFRELPTPLLTYSLYSSFVRAVRAEPGARLGLVSAALRRLARPNLATLTWLARHLHAVSRAAPVTGMTSRNLALVWAPNLLRSPDTSRAMVSEESLRDIGVQARAVEFMIQHYEELFLHTEPPRVGFQVGGDTRDVRDTRDTCPRSFHGSCVNLRPGGGGPDSLQQADPLQHKHLPKAMSASSMVLGSVSDVSQLPRPALAPSSRQQPASLTSSYYNTRAQPASMTSYYKSLPALDKHYDQLDRELQQLSDSVDVLYEQEDSEIDFLDSFLDYDDISVVDSSCSAGSRRGLPPVVPPETRRGRGKLRAGLRWLTYRGKASLRQLGTRDMDKTGDKIVTRDNKSRDKINDKTVTREKKLWAGPALSLGVGRSYAESQSSRHRRP